MDNEGLTHEEWLAEVAEALIEPEPPPGYFTAREIAPYVGKGADACYKWLRGLAERGEKGVEAMKIGRRWYFKLDNQTE